MRQKPKAYADSFWGDLVNALTLRPIYRPPVEAPIATATVTLQSATAEQATAAQQAAAEQAAAADDATVESRAVATVKHAGIRAAMGEDASSTNQPNADANATAKEDTTSTAEPKANASSTVEPKASAGSSVKEKESPSSTVHETQTFMVQQKEEILSSDPGTAPLRQLAAIAKEKSGALEPTRVPSPVKNFLLFQHAGEGIHPKAQSLGEFQRSINQATPVIRKLPPTLGGGYYTISMKPGDPSSPTPEAVVKELDRLLGIAQEQIARTTTSSTPAVPDPKPIYRAIRRALQRKLKKDVLTQLGFSEREAEILEGMSKGKTYRAIANRLGISPVTVQHSVKRMMAKVEVTQPDKLLKAVRILHHEWQRTNSVSLGGLSLNIKHEPSVYGQVIVSHQNPTLIQRPGRITIPEGHPDHPSNDEGGKKRTSQQGKRTPAHSTETSPPREPE